MNKVVLLDRNAYIEIEKKLGGRKYNKPRIRNLKKYDQYETFILALSIIEGEKSEIETPEEKENSFLKEITILNQFFKKAKTFSPQKLTNKNIEQEFKEILKDIYPDQKEDFASIKKFLEEVNEKLHNDVSKQKYIKYEQDIIDIAIKNKLSIYNPIVFCTFFVLHKNQQIRQIYKFGKDYDKKAYNVFSDFSMLKQYAMVKKNFKNRDKTIKVELLTFDTSLKYLNNHLNTKLDNYTPNLTYSVTFSLKLLTDSNSKLSEDESNKIIQRIENYYKKKTK